MSKENTPLAVRVRPQSLDAFVGQRHILGEGKLLRRIIISGRIPSLIFYGPAGCGKTTLGFIIAHRLKADFKYINAAFSSVSEVKKILKEAKQELERTHKKAMLFIDEIHRFNKLQQEALIPDTEQGTIVFVGATIYNPHYYLIPSLLSRSVVAQFYPLGEEEIKRIITQALEDKEKGVGASEVKITDEALAYLARCSSGDARKALNSLEIAVLTTPHHQGAIEINLAVAKETIQKNMFYDKKDSYHYDTISAFIKSVRGSDPDSALYWLAKMLTSGEDPRFIARRLVILASEDIGNANPLALVVATSTFKAVEFVGMPEARLILAQATTYLACSPKSNASYEAYQKAEDDVQTSSTQEVPTHLKTHSQEYKYPHAFGGYVEQNYGSGGKYYLPGDAGEEKKLKEFLRNLKSGPPQK